METEEVATFRIFPRDCFPFLQSRFYTIYKMNAARLFVKNVSRMAGRCCRRNFSETAVRKNIWIEEHNGIKEDLTNRFEWSGQNIMNTIVFLGLVPCFVYLVGKSAQDVCIPLSASNCRDSMKHPTERKQLVRPSSKIFYYTFCFNKYMELVDYSNIILLFSFGAERSMCNRCFSRFSFCASHDG